MTDRKCCRHATQSKPGDLELLEEILAKIAQELRNNEIKPRVSDLLKALELKLKMKLTERDKENLWELIDQIRSEELPDNSDDSPQE